MKAKKTKSVKSKSAKKTKTQLKKVAVKSKSAKKVVIKKTVTTTMPMNVYNKLVKIAKKNKTSLSKTMLNLTVQAL